MKRDGEEVANLRVRVTTRLAWLGISQKAFAHAIGMDKSRLSRAIRANAPRSSTLERIAFGLGMTVDDLVHEDALLLSPHPVIRHSMTAAEAESALSAWYLENSSIEEVGSHHHSDESRFVRRHEVREAMVSGGFCLELVRDLAWKYGVSHSQIYADRAFLERTEGVGRAGDESSSG